jgi:plasmid stabilization system protein ParE
VSDVFWSEGALDDMDAIAAYIAADNPAAALRVLDRIETAAERLGHAPIGRKGRVAGTYEKPVKDLPYIITYALQPMPGGDERVVVVRVIHGARDWPDGEWPK